MTDRFAVSFDGLCKEIYSSCGLDDSWYGQQYPRTIQRGWESGRRFCDGSEGKYVHWTDDKDIWPYPYKPWDKEVELTEDGNVEIYDDNNFCGEKKSCWDDDSCGKRRYWEEKQY